MKLPGSSGCVWLGVGIQFRGGKGRAGAPDLALAASPQNCPAGSMCSINLNASPPLLPRDSGFRLRGVEYEVYLPSVTYRVGIATGDRVGAGTDAHVLVELIGSAGRSGLRAIGSVPALFERGSIDWFDLGSEDLGELTAIRLKHDGYGGRPGWFVERVEVGQEWRVWTFPIHHWVASDEAPFREDITFDANGRIVG